MLYYFYSSAAVNAAMDNSEDVVVNLQPSETVAAPSLSKVEVLNSDGTVAALDVITEDLDISDDSEDEAETNQLPVNQETGNKPQPPPPSEEANQPNTSAEADEDGIWF